MHDIIFILLPVEDLEHSPFGSMSPEDIEHSFNEMWRYSSPEDLLELFPHDKHDVFHQDAQRMDEGASQSVSMATMTQGSGDASSSPMFRSIMHIM